MNKMDLISILGEENVFVNEPMKKHTTFRVGGPADMYVTPTTQEQIAELIAYCHYENIPYMVIGNGSNLLVADGGYRGIIIEIGKQYSEIRREDNLLYVQAGAMLSKVAHAALDVALTGMEFAAGIPGCIGGAVVMNAGAYGGEMKDIIREVQVVTATGERKTLSVEELELSYRHSVIPKMQYTVTDVALKLQEGNPEAIKARMDELKQQRVDKQPLEYPSAGSTFKRPQGYFAGKLIMDAGLRGRQVGGAAVSEKHCGFVVNKGDATATDIYELMKLVTDEVEKQFGVCLEPEVKMVGEFE